MTPRLKLLAGALFCLLAPILATSGRAAAATEAAQPSEAQRLAALFDAYFEDYLVLNPVLATSIGDPRYNDRFEISITPEWRARAEKLERDYLGKLETIDVGQLSGQDLLSYEIFKSARESEIEGFRSPIMDSAFELRSVHGNGRA